jgi:hypothetical protein
MPNQGRYEPMKNGVDYMFIPDYLDEHTFVCSQLKNTETTTETVEVTIPYFDLEDCDEIIV